MVKYLNLIIYPLFGTSCHRRLSNWDNCFLTQTFVKLWGIKLLRLLSFLILVRTTWLWNSVILLVLSGSFLEKTIITIFNVLSCCRSPLNSYKRFIFHSHIPTRFLLYCLIFSKRSCRFLLYCSIFTRTTFFLEHSQVFLLRCYNFMFFVVIPYQNLAHF